MIGYTGSLIESIIDVRHIRLKMEIKNKYKGETTC